MSHSLSSVDPGGSNDIAVPAGVIAAIHDQAAVAPLHHVLDFASMFSNPAFMTQFLAFQQLVSLHILHIC